MVLVILVALVAVVVAVVAEDADDDDAVDPVGDDVVVPSPASPKRNALIQASFCFAKNSASSGGAS